MSKDERHRADPNATIQVDPANVLDQVLLVDSSPPHSGRLTPPPLPPASLAGGVSPSTTAGSNAGGSAGGKRLTRAAVAIVLVGVAIAGGLVLGGRLGAKRAATAPVAGSASATPPTAASASGKVLTIPPIEIH